MKKSEVAISGFRITYNKIRCSVLVNVENAPKYYLARLRFVKNDGDSIDAQANRKSIEWLGNFFEFFKIKHNTIYGLGEDITSRAHATYINFNNFLRLHTPKFKPYITDTDLNNQVEDYFATIDPDADSPYIRTVTRNGTDKEGKQKYRTAVNAQKTKTHYPDVYETFKDDTQISFVYTDKKHKERTLPEIIKNFSARNIK